MPIYKEEYCEGVKNHCESGNSWISYAGEIDATLQEMLLWAKENPDTFGRSLEIAKLVSLKYWEDKAIDAVEDGNAQALQMAKFMLDQSFSLYEKAYNKNLNSVTPSDLNKRRINYGDASADRDILEEYRNARSSS